MPTILVADDSKVVQRVAERLLTAGGYHVTLASDGEDGALLALQRTIANLKRAGANDPESLEKILRTAPRMRWTAQEAGADSYVRLLDGLEIFLIITKGHRGSVSPDRFNAANGQLGLALPTVKQWMESGRARRAAVEQALRPPPPSVKRTRRNIAPV